MAPLQRGQKTLDGFFKRPAGLTRQGSDYSPDEQSTSSLSPQPSSGASASIQGQRALVLSPKRTWQEINARPERGGVGPGKRRLDARHRVEDDAVRDGQHEVSNHLRSHAAATPTTKSTRSAKSLDDVSKTKNRADKIMAYDGAGDDLEDTIVVASRSSPRVATPQDAKGTNPVVSPPTSSLTTLPETLSFSSTSTKRVSKDGVEMVRNSDSESESEDSDPLEDLEIIVARKSTSRPTTVASANAASVQTPQTVGRSRQSRAMGAAKSSELRQTPAYKFTPGSLLKSRPESQEDEERDELRSLSDSDDDRGITARTAAVDPDAIEALIPEHEEDPGHIKRVMQAMQRTDALREELVYYYLDPVAEAVQDLPDFPVESLSEEGWQSLLREPDERQGVFTSGLAARLSMSELLPAEVLLWILDAICVGTNELLSLRYLEVIKSSKNGLKAGFDSGQFLQRQFSRMRARNTALMDRTALFSKPDVEPALPMALQWFLKLLQILAQDFDQETLSNATKAMTRLLVDQRVSKEGSMFQVVQDTFEELLLSTDDVLKPKILRSLVQTWKHTGLQEALVQALPAQKREGHAFRRQLAYAFALEFTDKDDLSIPTDLSGFTTVTAHVTNLAKTNQTIDYAALASRIAMLDIAIDAGFSSRKFTRGSDAEQAFNDAVSRLAAAVRELESSLIGGGMSNLHKTTAKAALDQLWCRLQYAVRTVPPPQKDFFAGFDEEQEKKVRFMSEWVKGGSGG